MYNDHPAQDDETLSLLFGTPSPVARPAGAVVDATAVGHVGDEWDAGARRAAEDLAAYLSGNFNVHPLVYDAEVARGQRGMGRLAVDGLFGRQTRARMVELIGEKAANVGPAEILPPARPSPDVALLARFANRRPGRHGVSPAGDVDDVGDIGDGADIFGADDGARPPAATPRPAASAAASQRAAAANLIDYVALRLSTVRPDVADAQVRQYQQAMGGITADGKYGPATRARILALLGPQVVIPDPGGARPPAPTSTPRPAARSGSRSGWSLDDWEAADGLSLQEQAAVGLWGYAVRHITTLRSDVPDGNVRSYQTQLGLTADGKYGPATRGRIAALLRGVNPPVAPSSRTSPLPANPQPAPAATRPAAPPSSQAPAATRPAAPPTQPPRPQPPAPARSWLGRAWDAIFG